MTYAGFTLHDATGTELIKLPPTVRIASAVGKPDPYTWDRPPGSTAWFGLGDGIPSQRPQATLSGEWWFDTGSDATAASNAIETALSQAREVRLLGEHIANLEPIQPGVLQTQYGAMRRNATFTLILNLTDYLSALPTNATTTPGNITYGTTPSGGSGAGITKLADLYDVALGTLAAGQILGWNGTKWTNVALPTDKVGTLANLKTTAKSNAVVAINEVYDTAKAAGDAIGSEPLTTTAQTLKGAINELKPFADKIGDLATLTTTAKTDLVSAINEVKTAIGSGGSGGSIPLDGLTDVTITAPSANQLVRYDGTKWVNSPDKSGDLSALTTTAKSDLVSAINEVKASIPTVSGGGGGPVTTLQQTVYPSGSVTAATFDVPVNTLVMITYSYSGTVVSGTGSTYFGSALFTQIWVNVGRGAVPSNASGVYQSAKIAQFGTPSGATNFGWSASTVPGSPAEASPGGVMAEFTISTARQAGDTAKVDINCTVNGSFKNVNHSVQVRNIHATPITIDLDPVYNP